MVYWRGALRLCLAVGILCCGMWTQGDAQHVTKVITVGSDAAGAFWQEVAVGDSLLRPDRDGFYRSDQFIGFIAVVDSVGDEAYGYYRLANRQDTLTVSFGGVPGLGAAGSVSLAELDQARADVRHDGGLVAGEISGQRIVNLVLHQSAGDNGLSGSVLVKTGLQTRASPGVSSDVLALASQGDTVWVGTSAGLSRYAAGSVTPVLPDVAVLSLAVGRTVEPSEAAGQQVVVPDFVGLPGQHVHLLEDITPGTDIPLSLWASSGAAGAVGFRAHLVFDSLRVAVSGTAHDDTTAVIPRLDPDPSWAGADTLELTAFQEPGTPEAGSGWWPTRTDTNPALVAASSDSGQLTTLSLSAADGFTGQVRFGISHIEYFRRMPPSDSLLAVLPAEDAAIAAKQDSAQIVGGALAADTRAVRLDGNWPVAGDQGVRFVRDVRDSAVVEVVASDLGTGTVGFEAIVSFDPNALELQVADVSGSAVPGLGLIGPRPRGFEVTGDSVRILALSDALTPALQASGQLALLRFRPVGSLSASDDGLGESAVRLERVGYFTALADTTLGAVTADILLDLDAGTAGEQLTRTGLLPEARDSAEVLADSFPAAVRKLNLVFVISDTSRLTVQRFNLNPAVISGFASVEVTAPDTVVVGIQAFSDVDPPTTRISLGRVVFEAQRNFRDRVEVKLARVDFLDLAGQPVGASQTTEVPTVFSGVALAEQTGSVSGVVVSRAPIAAGQGVFSDTLAASADAAGAVASGTPSVWVGTRRIDEGFGGLFRLNRETGAEAAVYTAANSGLGDDDVSAVAVRSDTVWVGTLGEGLYRLLPDASDAEQWLRYQFPGASDTVNAQDNVISALAMDESSGGLWVGTAGGGVGYMYEDAPGGGAWKLIREETSAESAGLGFNFVSCIAVSDNTAWVGTGFAGLYRITVLPPDLIDAVERVSGGGAAPEVPKQINQITVSGDTVWAATSEGLLRLDMDPTGAVVGGAMFSADSLRGVGDALSSVAVGAGRAWAGRRPTAFLETVWDVAADTDVDDALLAGGDVVPDMRLSVAFVSSATGEVSQVASLRDSLSIDNVAPIIASVHPNADSSAAGAVREGVDAPLEVSAHVLDPGFTGVRSLDPSLVSVSINGAAPEPADSVEIAPGVAEVARHVAWALLDTLGGGGGAVKVGVLSDSTVVLEGVDDQGVPFEPIGLDSTAILGDFVVSRATRDTLAVIDRGTNITTSPAGLRLVRMTDQAVYHNLRVLPAVRSLGAGSHTISISVTDLAGNTATRDAAFTLAAADAAGAAAARLVSYPNPFESVRGTTIRFFLDELTDLANTYSATLLFFDVAGVPVHKIAMAGLSAGEHRLSWNGRTGSGDLLPNGVYVCELSASSAESTLTPVYWKMVVFNR